ncbi:hypothetical protein BD309DRAFT_946778 [Dichomitus squalens]|nr:hypothetical protein BD309DRAFT_946778 [Dichomitus squalens]
MDYESSWSRETWRVYAPVTRFAESAPVQLRCADLMKPRTVAAHRTRKDVVPPLAEPFRNIDSKTMHEIPLYRPR